MMLVRVLAALILLIAAAPLSAAPLARADGVSVTDITMAAPDIVHVEVRDPPFRSGGIVALDRPRSEANGSWVNENGKWGLVIGPKRDHLRLEDIPPDAFLDRDAAGEAQAYGAIGGRRVSAVYRLSMPYTSGLYRGPGGGMRSGASFRHDIYLKLDAPLPEGDHAISWPRGMLPQTPFSFDARKTRASAIRATQNGHRPGDSAKVAYLAQWLPGGPQQGALDFRGYGLDTFHVIDDSGARVFTAPIRLRMGPTDPEPGNGLPGPLVDYLDAAAVPVKLARLADGRFTTATPHGFKPGERIGLERLWGAEDAAAVFATVTSATDTSFTVEAPAGALPGKIADGATATRAHKANRAGTYVFELDYSAFVPAQDGTFRLEIPGLGVSDPIVIADDVWLRAGRISLGGLYNHRSGIPLDGRFGYTRPVAFRPGPDLVIKESRLPLAWSSEAEGGFVPFPEAARAPLITDRVMPDSYWGGYMDAGDWDRRIPHAEIASLLLDVLEATPADRRNVRLGVPRAREFLDHPAYADTDDLPDLVHEALWVLDFFRRLQLADGSIRGGIESAEHPTNGEPSFLEHHQVFAYAPDHLSTYQYAASAAKLSRILKNTKSKAAARLYEDSARAAWIAAERAFADPDAYYADAIAAGTKAGIFASTPWPTRRAEMQARAHGQRAAAAAAMFRLSGETEFAQAFETEWRAAPRIDGRRADAAWDYLNAAGADAAIADVLRARFLAEAKLVMEAQERFAYPGLKHPFAPAGWGQGGPPAYPELQLMIRAHLIGGDPKILATLQRAHHLIYGANQNGLSLVTGSGVRAVGNPLHEDRIAMGITAPPGITIYGWAPQAMTAYGWIFGPPWSPLPEVGVAENAAQRRIEPARFSLPYYDYLVEHPALIMQQEYTVQQTIGTMAALALYLAAR